MAPACLIKVTTWAAEPYLGIRMDKSGVQDKVRIAIDRGGRLSTRLLERVAS